jgi:hypothetical protein
MLFHEILYENSATGDHTTTITFKVPKQWPFKHMTWDQQYNHYYGTFICPVVMELPMVYSIC